MSFDAYLELLLTWNKRINLIGPGTVRDAAHRHVEDCRQLLPHFSSDACVLDMGSGAGLPGLVIAIGRPDVRVYAVEADGRKCSFLRHAAQVLALRNVTVHECRLEHLPPLTGVSHVTARALTALSGLLTHQLRVAPAAVGLYLKGRDAAAEISAAASMFGFTASALPSATDPDGRIVRIEGLRLLSDRATS